VSTTVVTLTSPEHGSAEVVIARDVASVYAVVSDVTHYGRFSPENRSARWLGSATGPVRGARFRSWNRRGLMRWFTYCVVESATGTEFSFRVTFPPPMPATRWRYELTPLDESNTRVVESWELPKPLGPARRTMMRLLLGTANRPSDLTAGAAATLSRMSEFLAAQ
jgi:hypothetical protein